MARHHLLLLSCLMGGSAVAGGHFDIDDAGTLDPGQCQVEAWGGRFGAAPTTTYHLGPSCGVGPVELGVNFERDSLPGSASLPGGVSYVIGPQVKWTFLGRDPEATLSAAAFASVGYDVTHGGSPGGQATVPVSWHALDSLWVNFNLGFDWTPNGGGRTGRGGLQGDWSFNDRMSLIAERFRSFGVWTSRVGMRFNLTPLLSLDVSGARTGPAGAWGFAVGLNQEFKGF